MESCLAWDRSLQLVVLLGVYGGAVQSNIHLSLSSITSIEVREYPQLERAPRDAD